MTIFKKIINLFRYHPVQRSVGISYYEGKYIIFTKKFLVELRKEDVNFIRRLSV